MGLLSTLFPKWALQRALLRHQLELAERRFKVHSTFRPFDSATASPDSAIAPALTDLRSRSRYLSENHDIYVGFLEELVNQIVGTGLDLEPMGVSTTGRKLQRFNEQALRVWKAWTEHPEVTGEIDWFELQRKLCWAWLADGEIFIRHITGGSYNFEGDVPYVLEVLESDYCPVNQLVVTNNTSQEAILGIKHDQWNRPTQYLFYPEHPGDTLRPLGVTLDNLKRVPASEVTHIKFTRRWPQTRGQPAMHSCFNRIQDLHDYEEYERIAAKAVGSWAVFLRKDPELYGDTIGALGDEEQRTLQMSPGMIQELLPGEEPVTHSVNRPNPELTNFRDSQVRAIASGAGTKFSTPARKWETSYTAMRTEAVDLEVGYLKLRGYFVSKALRETYQRVIRAAELRGLLVVPRTASFDSATRIEVNGPGIPHVDPKNEVEADLLEIAAELNSKTAVMRKRGRDPLKVKAQIEAEHDDEDASEGEEPADPIQGGDSGEGESGDEDSGSGDLDGDTSGEVIRIGGAQPR